MLFYCAPSNKAFQNTRLKDVEANHNSRFCGQSIEADHALQALRADCSYMPNAEVSNRSSYRAYRAAVRPLMRTVFGMV